MHFDTRNLANIEYIRQEGIEAIDSKDKLVNIEVIRPSNSNRFLLKIYTKQHLIAVRKIAKLEQTQKRF